MSDFTEILEDIEFKETQEPTDLENLPSAEGTPVENEGLPIDDPETLIDIMGKCGLFSKETDYIPDIVRFDDNIFNEEYYKKKHGNAFPEEWYKIMAEVSKKKFEDLRNKCREVERLAAKTVTWDN